MSDNVQYEMKTVTAVRGTEARTIAKMTAEGWEFVDRTSSKISSKLTFRRPKRQLSPAVIVAAAVIAVVVVVAITIGVITERDAPTMAAPPVSATTESGASARETQAPTSQASSTMAPSTPAPRATLTAQKNREFARVLKANECDDRMSAFATKHDGETVEFSGVILDLATRGDTRTRYDILITPGNTVDATEGPVIRYDNVNTTSDFGWTGPNIPDTVKEGTKLHFAAKIRDYSVKSCLLLMSPVATRAR